MTLKLSMMDGFSNNQYAKNVYLCIAYDEKEKEPVHAVANSSVRSDEINDYNRVLESYRLFIREDAPDPVHCLWLICPIRRLFCIKIHMCACFRQHLVM